MAACVCVCWEEAQASRGTIGGGVRRLARDRGAASVGQAPLSEPDAGCRGLRAGEPTVGLWTPSEASLLCSLVHLRTPVFGREDPWRTEGSLPPGVPNAKQESLRCALSS